MSPRSAVQIGLIAVNYNSAQATAQFLDDVLGQDTRGYVLTVTIADNSPSEADFDSLLRAYGDKPTINLERTPGNPGYFGAAQKVLTANWKDRLPDWIVVSNVDVRLPQNDFFCSVAQMKPGPGVIAPRILSGRSGLDQNPYYRRRPSAFRIYLNRIIPRVRVLYWLLEMQCSIRRAIRSRCHRSRLFAPLCCPTLQPATIYAPHGSLMIFGKEYFERGGNLNAGAFLYAEEIFVAESCRRLGLQVSYVPSLQVRHDEHVSTGKNRAVRHHMASAADYLFQEFFANPGKTRTAG